MIKKIYEIMQHGKTLRKYEVYHKEFLQGWVVAESPEKICHLYNWKPEDCRFIPQPFSIWERADVQVVK